MEINGIAANRYCSLIDYITSDVPSIIYRVLCGEEANAQEVLREIVHGFFMVLTFKQITYLLMAMNMSKFSRTKFPYIANKINIKVNPLLQSTPIAAPFSIGPRISTCIVCFQSSECLQTQSSTPSRACSFFAFGYNLDKTRPRRVNFAGLGFPRQKKSEIVQSFCTRNIPVAAVK